MGEGVLQTRHHSSGLATEREDIRSWAKTGDWTSIRNFWLERECGTPTAHTNQTQKFFDDTGDVLWVTFENGSLYYGFSGGGVVLPHEDGSGSYRTMAAHGWRHSTDAEVSLAMSDLSGLLTKTAGYRQTICDLSDEAAQYLKLKLEGKSALGVDLAEAAKQRLATALESIIKRLQPAEFELLVELIFASSGLKRTTATGGTQKLVDIGFENSVTGEKALAQVKSKTSQRELDEYISAKRSDVSGFTQMFFVYHTGAAATMEEDITIWNVAEVARQAVANGLVDWLIRRAR